MTRSLFLVLVLGLVLQLLFFQQHQQQELKKMVVVVRPNADEVGASVGELVLRVSQEAIATHGRFTLALSGGSLPKVRSKSTLSSATLITSDNARILCDCTL